MRCVPINWSSRLSESPLSSRLSESPLSGDYCTKLSECLCLHIARETGLSSKHTIPLDYLGGALQTYASWHGCVNEVLDLLVIL